MNTFLSAVLVALIGVLPLSFCKIDGKSKIIAFSVLTVGYIILSYIILDGIIMVNDDFMWVNVLFGFLWWIPSTIGAIVLGPTKKDKNL